ncbi:MAG: hypothetical protein OXI67_20020 [Candidatus Poribacteria bacterium]|nr:hypothetical protein [Candidatus Poribacteria bacterium]
MQSKISLFLRHYSYIVGALLALSVCGCGAIFPPEMYVPPNLPKSELATIKIDTTGRYMKEMNLIEVRVNGKRALRQKIEDNENITIHDVFVAPGKQDMSVTIRHKYWNYSPPYPRNLQTTSTFSAELKSGGTYLVKVLSAHYVDGGPFIELFDKNTGKVVSKNRRDRYDWPTKKYGSKYSY